MLKNKEFFGLAIEPLPQSAMLKDLSPAERRVLEAYIKLEAQGNTHIASYLDLSVYTVQAHIFSIRQKLTPGYTCKFAFWVGKNFDSLTKALRSYT